MNREKLLSHFRQKLSFQDLLEKKKIAENVKINLAEEIKIINKWIYDFESIAKFKHPP